MISIFVAIGGSALDDALSAVGLSGTIVELLVLLVLSLTLGYFLAASTADGFEGTWTTHEQKFYLRFFHLAWLYQLRRAPFGQRQIGWRFFNMWRFCRLAGVGGPSFAGAIGLTALALVYFFFLDDMGATGEAMLGFGLLFPILVIVNAFCLANLASARGWLRETLKVDTADLSAFLDTANQQMETMDTAARQRAWGVSIVLIIISWLTALTIWFVPALTDGIGTMFRSSATIILVSMSCSVTMIALTLTVLRDLTERVVQTLALAIQPGGGSSGRTDLLNHRTKDGNASPVRVIGRGLAFGLFALALIAPPWWLERTTRLPEFLAGDRGNLYSILPQGELVDKRPNVEMALRQWYADRFAGDERFAGQEVPLVIVASAGGASRSAAWFMTVMHELQLAGIDEAFDQHLFAISSVSGGSLGAVTYTLNRACGWRPVDRGDVKNLAQADLLKTSASRIFSADLVRRLPLVGMPVGFVDDRNKILERAFEAHWRTTAGFDADFSTENAGGDTQTIIDGHFLGLRSDAAFGTFCQNAKWNLAERRLPHLLLNGVDVSSGQRIVTSSIDISDDPEIMPNAIDFFDDFKADIRLSAAVMNSARFPLMSPAGLYKVNVENDDGSKAVMERQIIDGGYFENNGIETALDLIAEIDRIVARDKLAPQEERLGFTPVPALFLITNNAAAAPVASACPGLESADWQTDRLFHFETLTCEQESLPELAMQSYAAIDTDLVPRNDRVPELLAPIRGLFQIRDAHGQEALLDARNALCRPEEVRFFHVGLPKPTCPQTAAPMNWVLHEGVANYFMNDAILDPHVQWQIHELAQFLNRMDPLSAKSAQ